MEQSNTKEVAVITSKFRDFLEYSREQTDPNERYIFANSINKIRGYRFARFVKLHNYREVNGFNEIIEYCEKHLLTSN